MNEPQINEPQKPADGPKLYATRSAILGTVLALARHKMGLTQAQFAQAMHVAPSTWSRIEKGDTSLSVEQLREAAEVLGLGITKLLELVTEGEHTVQQVGAEVRSKPKEASSQTTRGSAAHIATGFLNGFFPMLGAGLGALLGQALESKLNAAFTPDPKPEADTKKD